MPFAAVAVVLGVLVTMCGTGAGDGDEGRTGGGHADPTGVRLGWGFTHTQRSADEGAREARDRVALSLEKQGLPQNQHLMGWGAGNPEPSPGRYDFRALDSRIKLITESGGTPVITLCCAPDWMKGGKAGETDWDELETAPRPEHYADFAKLAGKVAARYPDVRHFQVWNEFKGFFDDERGRWDYEAYTRLYNLVYAEVKRVREDSLIGGPYVVMDSVADPKSRHASGLAGDWGAVDQRSLDALRYWNRHRAGADFVVVDGSSYTKDHKALPDEFAATEKFTAVGEWVREETGLPLWWAEWYVEPPDRNDERKRWSEPRRLAVQAAGMRAMARGGADTGLYWNPQRAGGSCPGCLWSHTDRADGGESSPMLELLSRFGREFPPGTRFTDVPASGASDLLLLADADTVLAVNTTGRTVTAEIEGKRLKWQPYAVRWLDR